MKKMRKVAGMLMAATVAMAMPMSAMAASITVDGAIKNETYKAYKIFDYAENGGLYSYTMAADSEWRTFVEGYEYATNKKLFTLVPSADDAKLLEVKVNAEKNELTEDLASAFAAELAKNIPAGVDPDEEVRATADGAVFTKLGKGYYFVNTTTGSLCSLVNNESSQKLKEKNELPTGEKKIVNGDATTDSITATIGDTITYKITVTDKKGTDKEITVHDKMDAGLILDKTSIKVIKGETELIKGTDYTYDADATYTDGCTFEVVLNASLVQNLDKNDKVEIVYSAKVGKEAIVAGAAGSKNSAKIDYSHNTIDIPGEPEVYTYKFNLVKTNKANEVLSGAKFRLYSDAEAKNEIKVVKLDDGNYRVAEEGETGVEIEAGVTEIKGLGNGTYYLVETAAPENYNPLTEAVEVPIANGDKMASFNEDGTYKEGGVQVINYTGTILPSTGGIGTTIFYAAGIVVMAGAVFFVVRSRKHD